MRLDLGDALDVLELGLGLLHHGDIRQVDDEAVAQDLVVETLGEIGAVILHEAVKGLAAGDECGRADVVDRVDLALERSCVFLGIGVVDKGDDLVLVLQPLDEPVDVQTEQRNAAHDDQARHNDRDRCEGHEAVRANASEALPDQITASIQSHS